MKELLYLGAVATAFVLFFLVTARLRKNERTAKVIEAGGFIYLVFGLGICLIVTILPLGLAIMHSEISRDVANGTAFIGNKKVSSVSEVYMYPIEGWFMSYEDSKIRDLERWIVETKKGAIYGEMNKHEKARVKRYEEQIEALKKAKAQQ